MPLEKQREQHTKSWQLQCLGTETVWELCSFTLHGCILPNASHKGEVGFWGAQSQTAARGTSRRGKMSPSETIKLLNKIRCLSECSLFFSVCLGSATLTSWPYRGAAEWTGLIAQETGALANFSAPVKPGQELNAFALQKNSSLSFPSFLSATP